MSDYETMDIHYDDYGLISEVLLDGSPVEIGTDLSVEGSSGSPGVQRVTMSYTKTFLVDSVTVHNVPRGT